MEPQDFIAMTVAVGSAEHDEAARGYAKFTQHLNSRSVDRTPWQKVSWQSRVSRNGAMPRAWGSGISGALQI